MARAPAPRAAGRWPSTEWAFPGARSREREAGPYSSRLGGRIGTMGICCSLGSSAQHASSSWPTREPSANQGLCQAAARAWSLRSGPAGCGTPALRRCGLGWGGLRGACWRQADLVIWTYSAACSLSLAAQTTRAVRAPAFSAGPAAHWPLRPLLNDDDYRAACSAFGALLSCASDADSDSGSGRDFLPFRAGSSSGYMIQAA